MPFGPLSAVPRRRVVVTGMGLVTPVGTTASETWSALCRGVSGTHALDEVPYFLPFCLEERKMSDETRSALRQQLINALPCRVAASVREDGSGKPRFAPTPRAPRSFAFCSAATEEALGDAELLSTAGKQELLSGLNCDRVGVNIGTGIPSVADVADVAVLLHGNLKEAGVRYSQVHPFFVPKMLGNMAAGVTAIRYGITGPVGSSVAACATGAQCIGESAGWIRHGRADVVVCGATEASITPTSIAGFCRMRALCATFNDRPEKASRPFDTQRDGFVMGEGAGILVLEELEHARKRGAKIYAEVRGFGLACDAFDVAAPHPDGRGAGCCIQDALHDGGDVPAKVVGYINAHATGTMGDDIELTAVGRTLRPENESGSPLYVSSTKGSVGHLLGAAGSVEAAVAILALKHQQAPPCVNLDVHGSWKSANNSSSAAAFPTSPLIQVGTAMSIVRGNEPQPWAGEAAISTSFGFGGANTALLFTSAP